MYLWTFVGVLFSVLITKNSTPKPDFFNQDEQYLCARNTLALNNRLCLEITETPAYLYKEFLASIANEEGKTSAAFIENEPNFKVWTNAFPNLSAEELANLFYSSDEFALMPIVGITRQQAEAFCEWRTEAFKKELEGMSKRERARFPKDFVFRLPSAKEWGIMRFKGQPNQVLDQIEDLANQNSKSFKLNRSKTLKNSKTLTDIYDTPKEQIGYYNVFNNVAEMTYLEGVSVGGGWNLPTPNTSYTKEFSYEKAEAWLGIRCIFEILD